VQQLQAAAQEATAQAAQHRQAIAALNDRLATALAEAAAANTRTLGEASAQHQAALAALQLAAAEAAERGARERQAELDSVRAIHVEQLRQQEAIHAARSQQLVGEAREQADSLQQAAEASSQAALAEQEARITERLRQQHEDETQRIRGVHERALEQVKEVHAGLQREGSAAQARLQDQLAAAEEGLRQATQRLAAEAEARTALQAESSELRQELARMGREVLEVRREGTAALQATEKALVSRHRTQLEDVIARYREQFARAGAEATRSIEGLRAEAAGLRANVSAAEQRYEERPSRPEDTVRIADLTAALAAAQDRVAFLSSHNKRLGMEVISQEQTFNRLFKATPSVGRVDPLAATARRGSSATIRLLAGGATARSPVLAATAAVGNSPRRQPLPPVGSPARAGSTGRP